MSICPLPPNSNSIRLFGYFVTFMGCCGCRGRLSDDTSSSELIFNHQNFLQATPAELDCDVIIKDRVTFPRTMHDPKTTNNQSITFHRCLIFNLILTISTRRDTHTHVKFKIKSRHRLQTKRSYQCCHSCDYVTRKDKTSQELRMLSSVTINCQITKIVMNSGSQLSEFSKNLKFF